MNKTFFVYFKKGGGHYRKIVYAKSSRDVRDWFQRISRTGRYKGSKIPGIKRLYGAQIVEIKQRKKARKKSRRRKRQSDNLSLFRW